MMKRRIAILISLMLAAPAAVVALEKASTGEGTAEMTQPAETTAAPAESATPLPEQAVVVEQQTTVVAVEQPAARNPVSRFFGNIQQARASDAFPEGSMDGDYALKALPSQQQYFARLEQQRASMLARGGGTGFPMGSANGEDFHKPLPAQMAYWDRAEQQRIAASQPRPVAQAEMTPAPISSTEQTAQAGSAEVAIADTSAIR